MIVQQIGLAALFYFLVVSLFRIAGKRFAGQTTTFDLIILISLGVALQQVTLLDGTLNAMIFVATVFLLHWAVAKLCQKSQRIRYLVRGRPCSLIKNGHVLYSSLRAENMTFDELQAGLRKLGIDDVSKVQVAHLEETGQVSAIRMNA